MSAIPAAYRGIIEPLIAMAREILERGEELAPFAFVGNLTTREVVSVLLNTESAEEKAASAALVHEVAQRIAADFVFVILDAWGLPAVQADRYPEILARYGSIGDSPYRIDLVSFTLEARHGLWAAQVAVEPKDGPTDERTFGVPRFELFPEPEGRFVDLLPLEEGDAQGAGRLH